MIGGRAVGLDVIILYKLVKAVFEALVGVLALVLLWQGAEAGAATLAQVLLDHVTRTWALQLATVIVIAGTAGHVKVAAIAAFGDSALSALEGIALRRGKWWAPWLVVVATSAFLPLEVLEILRRPSLARGTLFVLNLCVVLYLLTEVVREQRARRLGAALPPGAPVREEPEHRTGVDQSG